MDRLVHFLEGEGETRLPIVAEARGKQEDNTLEKVFYRIQAQGSMDNLIAEGKAKPLIVMMENTISSAELKTDIDIPPIKTFPSEHPTQL